MASLCLFFFLALALVPAALGRFSVELINRDSPKSPLYDPSVTTFDRWRMAVERSHERARHFATRHISTSSSIVSPVVPNSGSYLMKLSLGTPPVDIHAIADTGSDLIWTDCVPCTQCYKQKAPLFNPTKSSSYSNISCSTDLCNTLQTPSCDETNNCEYEYSYGDGSRVIGLLAKENFTFSSGSDGDVSVAATVFGCSHQSGGSFDSNTGGLVGLGGGALSLVSQLGDSIQNQFSYCLLSHSEANTSSELVFGPDDRAPSKISKTPIIRNEEQSTFYSLTLVNITVGDKSIPVSGASSSASSTGNIIIDSGTTLTILDSTIVEEVATEVKKAVKLAPVTDPKYGIFGACFALNGTEKDLDFPEISFAFDGANVPLQPQNMLVQVDESTLCLALTSSDGLGGIQIYGNIAQQDFYVAYDLGQNELSIAPANCAKF